MKKLSLFLVAIVCVLVSCKPDPEPEKPTVMTKSVEENLKDLETIDSYLSGIFHAHNYSAEEGYMLIEGM